MLSACKLAHSGRRQSSDSKANTSACRSAESHSSAPSGTLFSAGTHNSSSATNYAQSALCSLCSAAVVLRIRYSSMSYQSLLRPFKSPRRTRVIYSTNHRLPRRRGMARNLFCKCRLLPPAYKPLCLGGQSNPRLAHSKSTPEDHRFR